MATVLAAVLCAALIPASGRAATPGSNAAQPEDSADSVVAGSFIVTLKPGVDPEAKAPGLARGAGGHAGRIYRHALNGFVFKGSAKAAAALARNPNVRTVVPDRTLEATVETSPAGIKRIRSDHPTQPDAHDSGFTGAGVRVAILDTGIDLTHPDLVANIDAGLGLNCMAAGPPQDGHGHGTHVAGIVAAVAGNGMGVVGVAPAARLVPFKVLDDTGNGAWSNVICAIDILTGYATDADPANDVRVANMSLGDVGPIGSCDDGGVRQAICTSVAAGITYVAAAGNSTVDASTFIPAAFPEVITVSAMTDLDGEPGGLGGCLLFIFYCDDTLAEFSNYGSVVDVTAPGFQVYSTWTGGGYQNADGTSMAAPHVAGVAALVRAANPALRPSDVEVLLKFRGECPNGTWADADGSGDCIGKGQRTNDPDGYGEPLVSALRAAQAAAGWDSKPTIEITNPADGSSVSGFVTVTATAADDQGVTKVEFFLNGQLQATDIDGSDGWSMIWNAGGAPIGLYTLKATATDTGAQTTSDEVTVTTDIQGDWVGSYGVNGHILGAWNGGSDLVGLPSGVTYTLEQGSRHTWASPTTEVRALESPSEAERRATAWYHASQLRIRLNFTTSYTGTLHLYAVDWDTTLRRQNVTVDDGAGPRTVNLTAAFNPGAWLQFPIAVGSGGSVLITADNLAGTSSNAVLSGLFLGGAGTPVPPPPPPTTDLPGVQGDWVGSYGVNGHILGAWNGGSDLVGLPSGVTYTLEQGSRHTWASPTTEVRALESPSEAERRATAWYHASQLRIRVNFSAAYSGKLHLYAVDWDTTTRRQDVTVDDGTGPRTVRLTAAFDAGAWMHYDIAVGAGGSVVITLDNLVPAQNAVLSGLFLGQGAAPATTPGAPTLTAATRGNAQVALAWTAPASNGGSVITGYTATASPGGATCSTPTLDCTITGLTNGTIYSFSVTATNAVGTGPASNTLSATPAAVPGAPTGLTATAGNAQVALAWTAPASDGGSPITNYRIYRGTVSGTETLLATVEAVFAYTDTAVANGTTYYYQLSAVTVVGEGTRSAEVSAKPATVPAAPRNLVASTNKSRGVNLTWLAPASNGGSVVTGYRIFRGASSGTETFFVAVGNVTSYRDTTTIRGIRYYYKITAVNALGEGAFSTEASAVAK